MTIRSCMCNNFNLWILIIGSDSPTCVPDSASLNAIFGHRHKNYFFCLVLIPSQPYFLEVGKRTKHNSDNACSNSGQQSGRLQSTAVMWHAATRSAATTEATSLFSAGIQGQDSDTDIALLLPDGSGLWLPAGILLFALKRQEHQYAGLVNTQVFSV